MFIGECGNINHGRFTEKCPHCNNEIGARGYGQPFGLIRVDKLPVWSADKKKLYVTLPGFQESRP